MCIVSKLLFYILCALYVKHKFRQRGFIMPYDIETDNDTIELIPGQKIKADHIYINDVDIDTLTETVAILDKKVDAINRKLDKIIETLANDNAIVCSKVDGRWNCHINMDNSIQEDEPLSV